LAHREAMHGYHLFFAARADLLRRAKRLGDALSDYERALELVGNEPERRYLQKRVGQVRLQLTAAEPR